MTRAIRLTIAYDGAEFLGWQAQAAGRTVQQTLEAAIAQLTGESVRVLASGRTDTGVHALGQVVSFRTNSHHTPAVFERALNALLPADVAVLHADEVPVSFHPIRDCLAKRYRYLWRDGPGREIFTRRHVWQIVQRLNDDAMRQAAAGLIGQHDFAAFQSSGAPRNTTVRHVTHLSLRRTSQLPAFAPRSSINSEDNSFQATGESGDFLVMEIAADGFLYNMVRAIAGTLTEVGLGKHPPEWPAAVLATCDRTQAGPTAPPHALFLVSASYTA